MPTNTLPRLSDAERELATDDYAVMPAAMDEEQIEHAYLQRPSTSSVPRIGFVRRVMSQPFSHHALLPSACPTRSIKAPSGSGCSPRPGYFSGQASAYLNSRVPSAALDGLHP